MRASKQKRHKGNDLHQLQPVLNGKNKSSNSLRDPKEESVQAKLKVSQPGDHYEKQADQVADQYVHQTPVSRDSRSILKESNKLTLFSQAGGNEKELDLLEAKALEKQIQPSLGDIPEINGHGGPKSSEIIVSRAAEKQAVQKYPNGIQQKSTNPVKYVDDSFENTLNQNLSGGEPLPTMLRLQMEAFFGADLSGIQIHTDSNAILLARHIGAKAFTFGRDIFFNAGFFNPNSREGQWLIAHELAHTMQQGFAPPQYFKLGLEQKMLQADFWDDVLDFVKEYVDYIPGYSLMSFIIGYDFIRGEDVDRSPKNFLKSLMGLHPLGMLAFNQLDKLNLIDRSFQWVERQFRALSATINRSRILRIVSAVARDLGIDLSSFTSALISVGELIIDSATGDGLSAEQIKRVFERRFSGLLQQLEQFALRSAQEFLRLIKDALIDPLLDEIDDLKGYEVFTKLMGYDPIKGEEVNASTKEVLKDFLILLGKEEEVRQMEERETLQKTADWLDDQKATFSELIDELGHAFRETWENFSLEDLRDPFALFERLVNRFAPIVQQFWDFGVDVALTVLQYVKDALLGWLKNVANEVPGYHLLTVILGEDPFTKEVVERNAENLIRGFIGLLPGGEEKFQEIKASGIIEETLAWINAEVDKLGLSLEDILKLFEDIWNSFTIDDLINPLEAFQRVINKFGEPLGRILVFLKDVTFKIISVGLELVGFPTDLVLNIISNIQSAFEDIKRDLIAFFINLLLSVKEGFSQFFENAGTHLLNGIADWFFDQLEDANIKRPPDLSLSSIFGLVLDVLGISPEKIFERIGNKMGPEKTAQLQGLTNKVEEGFAFLADLYERWPDVIWEKLKEGLSGLWSMFIGFLSDWAIMNMIESIGKRLLNYLDPTGIMAVVKSIQDLITLIESIGASAMRMLRIVGNFVEGIAQIARGQVKVGADALERALAGGIPVALIFVGKFLGLDNLGERIGEMLAPLRSKVNDLLEPVLDFIARSVVALLEAGEELLGALGLWWSGSVQFVTPDGQSHRLYFEGEGTDMKLFVASEPKPFDELVADREEELDENSEELGALNDAKLYKAELDAKIDEYGSKKDKEKEISGNTNGSNELAAIQQEIVSLEAEMDQKLNQIKEKLKEAGIEGYSGEIGTPQNPLQIVWHKPDISKYPVLLINTFQEQDPEGKNVLEEQIIQPTDRKPVEILFPPDGSNLRREWNRGFDIVRYIEGEIYTIIQDFQQSDQLNIENEEEREALRSTYQAKLEASRNLVAQKEDEYQAKEIKVYELWRAQGDLAEIEYALEQIESFPNIKVGVQNRLKLAEARLKDTESKIKEFLDTGQDTRTITLGITQEFQTVQNKTFGPIPSSTPSRGGKQDELRELLGYGGWDMSANGEESEHVLDLVLGGRDLFENLWPLEGTLNVPPNQQVNKETGIDVNLPEGEEPGVNIKNEMFKGMYFKIIEFP